LKNKNNQCIPSMLQTTMSTLLLLGASGSIFAQGIGVKYGTRDPRTCADTKAPGRGAMTPALATKYVICAAEGVQGEMLYLIEDLTNIQVGGSRPFSHNTDSVQDIDVTAPVYPFRTGSYKSYQCAAVYKGNQGYNCNIYPYPKGTGGCRKSTFGDWNCTLDYQSVDRSQVQNNVPPPTSAKGAATSGANTSAQNGNQTAAAKTGANENGLPAPDFSEMEKYFQIVRYEYSPADHSMNLLLKMTKKTNICDWELTFYDADGVKVTDTSKFVGNQTCSPELGEPTRAYANLLQESKWKYVKKVVITRHIY
jgi:hypothetical protein